MIELPSPLTPVDCNLQDFAFMPVDVKSIHAHDSPVVLALKAQINRLILSPGQNSRVERRRLNSRIRAQRLHEARERGSHTEEEWAAVVDEFDRRCVQCGCRPADEPAKDHIVPICLGGSDAIDNLQPLCRTCNSGKSLDTFNWAAYRRTHGFSVGQR